MSNEAVNSAFPVPHFTRPDGDIEWGSFGLTKRELFAAMAMQGLLATGDYRQPDREYMAIYAVQHADAVLAELAKRSVG